MADAAAEPPEDDALWRFSLAFYASPGVAQALIALQDRDQLDVNLMLFALWLGVSGRGRLSSPSAMQTAQPDVSQSRPRLRGAAPEAQGSTDRKPGLARHGSGHARDWRCCPLRLNSLSP